MRKMGNNYLDYTEISAPAGKNCDNEVGGNDGKTVGGQSIFSINAR